MSKYKRRPRTEFSMSLIVLRQALGLTQKGLAKLLKVHPTTVAFWETGRQLPAHAPVRARLKGWLGAVEVPGFGDMLLVSAALRVLIRELLQGEAQ